MVTRDFSGEDVVNVLGNKGNFEFQRMNGDHAITMDCAAGPRH